VLLVCRETERQQLAVKTVFKAQIEDGIRLSKLNCELAILRRLRHENLIELVDEFDNASLHCIVMPLYVVRSCHCELIRFLRQKVKRQGHSETRYGQLNTLGGIISPPPRTHTHISFFWHCTCKRSWQLRLQVSKHSSQSLGCHECEYV